MRFRKAFDLVLQGYKVRATQWSPEYYLVFNGNLWLLPNNRIVTIADLNIWRQTYITWEVYDENW